MELNKSYIALTSLIAKYKQELARIDSLEDTITKRRELGDHIERFIHAFEAKQASVLGQYDHMADEHHLATKPSQAEGNTPVTLLANVELQWELQEAKSQLDNLVLELKNANQKISDMTMCIEELQRYKNELNHTNMQLEHTKRELLTANSTLEALRHAQSALNTVVATTEIPPPPPETTVAAPPPKKASIVLVEDNPINAKIASAVLRRHQFEVEVAGNGQVALEKVKLWHDNIQMILMAIHMPVMDGLTCARLLRQYENEHNLPQIPIIALTADATSLHRTACLEAGCDEFMSRPLDYLLLIEILKKLSAGGVLSQP